MYTYRATLLRVIDGDTCELDIDLGIFTHRHERVRIAHIDTPERGQLGWSEARDYLALLLSQGSLLVRTVKDREKYGRFLAEITIEPEIIGGVAFGVGGALVEKGFAVWRDYG